MAPAPKKTPEDVLSHACFVLRNAAPEEWDYFKRAFFAYARDIERGVVKAGADHVLIAQGSARQCWSLETLHNECEDRNTPKPTAPVPHSAVRA